MGAGLSTANNEFVATPCKEKDKLHWPAEQMNRLTSLTSLDADVKKCPTCSSVLHLIQGPDSQSAPGARCLLCPARPFLCGTCLSPWQGSPGAGEGRCGNSKCALVGTLLACGLITDPKSKVRGCPEFRACPKCCSLLMHGGGCNYVSCMQCGHCFCYICLSDPAECLKGGLLSLTCSKPAAGRQRFST